MTEANQLNDDNEIMTGTIIRILSTTSLTVVICKFPTRPDKTIKTYFTWDQLYSFFHVEYNKPAEAY